ncbi:putative major facilitator superfamily transporter [Phaeomoniella chlamydospora]|uniref:Putative major facilitator superfamily transporter n=1 Tax=Phaeomoniella chlamydospora TaxID=158046 RepID=A0A0G2GPN7_PHACM|nr:putative major facilitator superfamily transporter [Phaeomoniella chlamydospora]
MAFPKHKRRASNVRSPSLTRKALPKHLGTLTAPIAAVLPIKDYPLGCLERSVDYGLQAGLPAEYAYQEARIADIDKHGEAKHDNAKCQGIKKLYQPNMSLIREVFASSYGKSRPDFFIWYPKGTPASEKKLLFKIDWFILTYGCLAYFTKYLDQANLSNAYVSGSWYKKTELGKRTAIFSCAAYVGTMIAGYLQSAVLAGLNGRYGLSAWRWVFIIDGIITVIVAIYGMIFFPDTPHRTTAFYFSKEDKDRAVERFWNTTVGKVANTVMQLYLKYDTKHTWSVYQVNNIPTAINGWNIVMIMLENIYVDATGCRMIAVAVNLAILLFGTICLVVWNIPLGLRIVSYMFAGLDGPLSPLYMAWANILCSQDAQVRALTIAIMNSCGAALTTIIQQFLYPVTDAPQYHKGFRASLGFICGMCIWVVVVRLFEMKAVKKKEAAIIDAKDGEAESVGVEAGIKV